MTLNVTLKPVCHIYAAALFLCVELSHAFDSPSTVAAASYYYCC